MKCLTLIPLALIMVLSFLSLQSPTSQKENRREIASVEEVYLPQELNEQVAGADCVECALKKQQEQIQMNLAQAINYNQQILVALNQGLATPSDSSIYQQMDYLTAGMLASSMPAMNSYQFSTPILDQLYTQSMGINGALSWGQQMPDTSSQMGLEGFNFMAPTESMSSNGYAPYGRYQDFMALPEFNFGNAEESASTLTATEFSFI